MEEHIVSRSSVHERVRRCSSKEQNRSDVRSSGLCHAELNSRTLRVEILKRLRSVIPINVSFFTTADPATLLFTGAVVDDILARATPQFIENEFLHDDVNKFSWLARSATPVGGLIQATQRNMEQSPRYREVLAPLAL